MKKKKTRRNLSFRTLENEVDEGANEKQTFHSQYLECCSGVLLSFLSFIATNEFSFSKKKANVKSTITTYIDSFVARKHRHLPRIHSNGRITCVHVHDKQEELTDYCSSIWKQKNDDTCSSLISTFICLCSTSNEKETVE